MTESRLRLVEDAEEYFKSLGLTQVRVRLEGADLDVARVEVLPEEFDKVLRNAKGAVETLPFRRVTLDLRGYS